MAGAPNFWNIKIAAFPVVRMDLCVFFSLYRKQEKTQEFCDNLVCKAQDALTSHHVMATI